MTLNLPILKTLILILLLLLAYLSDALKMSYFIFFNSIQNGKLKLNLKLCQKYSCATYTSYSYMQTMWTEAHNSKLRSLLCSI